MLMRTMTLTVYEIQHLSVAAIRLLLSFMAYAARNLTPMHPFGAALRLSSVTLLTGTEDLVMYTLYDHAAS